MFHNRSSLYVYHPSQRRRISADIIREKKGKEKNVTEAGSTRKY
jgi:hypothetical protein